LIKLIGGLDGESVPTDDWLIDSLTCILGFSTIDISRMEIEEWVTKEPKAEEPKP
jgi:hypothetical protein